MTGPPPRRAERPLALPPEAFPQLREVLRRAGYTREGVLERVGVGDLAAPREGDVDQLLHRTRRGTPLDTLVRLLLIGSDVPADAAERAVAPMKLEAWLAAGLLEASGSGVRGAVRVLPFEDLLLAFDRPERGRDEHVADYVMGVGSSTLTLAGLCVRRPARASLDLGTGCGTLAFLAAAHSERVVAVDRNPRAVAIADFNARLNGLERVVECREGDLFEPVAGERFDLVVSNPPFVISPESRFIYRDSGLGGDRIAREIVRRVPAHLEEGGVCQILCNWAHIRGQDVDERLAGWFAGTGCDAWVMTAETRDPGTYASTWIRHTEGGDPERASESFRRWLDFYEGEGIEAISAGSIHLRRRSGGRNWFRSDPAPSLVGPAGADVLAGFARRDWLEDLPTGPAGDRALLATPLRVDPDVRLEQQSAPGEGGWELRSARLRRSRGLAYAGDADPLVAGLVVRCTGRVPLGEALGAVAELAGTGREAVVAAALPVVRRLVEQGFLVPPDRPPEAGR